MEVENGPNYGAPDAYLRIFILLHYITNGEKENTDKVKKAIELSLEKYCGCLGNAEKELKDQYTIITFNPNRNKCFPTRHNMRSGR
jgi:uncharacterized OsmC-like protein